MQTETATFRVRKIDEMETLHIGAVKPAGAELGLYVRPDSFRFAGRS